VKITNKIQPQPDRIKALKSLRTLCALGLPPKILIPAVLEALHGVIDSARNLFDWVGDDVALTDYYVEGAVDVPVAKHYFSDFYNQREALAMPAFASLGHTRETVRGARELDKPAFYQSDLYREIWLPQALHSRMEGIVRGSRGQLLGSLVLYRGPQQPLFSLADEATLAQLLPMIASALERNLKAEPTQTYAPKARATETMLLDAQGHVLHLSAGAHGLLMLADEGLNPRALNEPIDALAARQCAPLLRGLSRAVVGEERRVAPTSTINAYGRFDASATVLWPHAAARPPTAEQVPARAYTERRRPPLTPSQSHPQPLLQVTLQWLEPQPVALQRLLLQLPITAGQSEVCSRLAQGRTQADIAKEMGVANSTVVDHVRKIYAALEVSSVSQLVALLEQRLRNDKR
jgi:DNA-binding CsgD family transcriptional regulator